MEIPWDQGGVRVQQRVEHSNTIYENFTFQGPVFSGLAGVSAGNIISSWPAHAEITGISGEVQAEVGVV